MSAVLRSAAIMLAILVTWLASQHATVPFFVWGLCLVFSGIALFSESAWLTTLPVAIVVGSWYPWTGQLLVEERDLFLLSILAALMWRQSLLSVHPKLGWLQSLWTNRWHWILYGGVAGVAFIQGMVHLPEAAYGDSLSIYTTRNNALAVFKALLIGFAFAPFLRRAAQDTFPHTHQAHSVQFNGMAIPWLRFTLGMRLSACIVACCVIAERFVSYGLLDFSQILRVTGPFTSMHVGGQHIDAFWGVALPFVFQFYSRRRWSTLLLWILQVLSIYAIFATMSRALIGFSLVSIVLLAVIRAMTRESSGPDTRSPDSNFPRRRTIAMAVAISVLLLVGTVGLLIGRGGAVKQRFESTAADWRTRTEHWNNLLSEFTSEPMWQQILGHGMGSFPRQMRSHLELPTQPISISGEQRVRIYAGQRIFLEQWLISNIQTPLTVRASVRSSSTDCRVKVQLCEKLLLQSFSCVGGEFRQLKSEPGIFEVVLDPTLPIKNPLLGRHWCPRSLAFSVAGHHGDWIELSNVTAYDNGNLPILHNGDFRDGSKRWSFTCDDHLVWRAKNMWLHQALEMGWLGVFALAVLVFKIWFRILWRCANISAWPAAVLCFSLTGFLCMGVFGTLIDTSWLLTFFLFILAFTEGCTEKSNCSAIRLAAPDGKLNPQWKANSDKI